MARNKSREEKRDDVREGCFQKVCNIPSETFTYTYLLKSLGINDGLDTPRGRDDEDLLPCGCKWQHAAVERAPCPPSHHRCKYCRIIRFLAIVLSIFYRLVLLSSLHSHHHSFLVNLGLAYEQNESRHKLRHLS